VLLFFSITFFGGFILMGVVEEKSSAVVEVLLSHVRPHQLLIGKVLGTALAALVQFGAAVAAGLVALNIAGIEVPRAVWVALPSSLFWMIGGFLLYSTLFAVAGSLVSRQEDAQTASLPITMVVSIAYVMLIPIGSEPDSTVARVLSMVPPLMLKAEAVAPSAVALLMFKVPAVRVTPPAPLLLPERVSVPAVTVVRPV